MADKAELSTADYQDLAEGTKLFTVDEAHRGVPAR